MGGPGNAAPSRMPPGARLTPRVRRTNPDRRSRLTEKSVFASSPLAYADASGEYPLRARPPVYWQRATQGVLSR